MTPNQDFSSLSQSTRARLPDVTPLHASTETREMLLNRKAQRKFERTETYKEARDKTLLPDARGKLLNESRKIFYDEMGIESQLRETYVPQHAPRQFISPRLFFRSPLFRVASRAAPRNGDIQLVLSESNDEDFVRYIGPELRQTDGLIFTALLNMLRDLPAGTPATFPPKALCLALFGNYDGRSRPRLANSIRRLLRGQIITKNYTVQLCCRFDHPSHGQWTVAMDRDIVRLFARACHVWLDIDKRLSLPEGLASWLYGFIESQSTLIPTSVSELRRRCGTDSGEAAFLNTLRLALAHLNTHNIIEPGYKVSKSVVKWRKVTSRATSATL